MSQMLALIGMGVCAWVMVQPLRASQQRWLRLGMPALLLCGILLIWNVVGNWGQRVWLVTSDAVGFLGGEYSLAEAYSRIETGNRGSYQLRCVGCGTASGALYADLGA